MILDSILYFHRENYVSEHFNDDECLIQLPKIFEQGKNDILKIFIIHNYKG